MENITLEEPTTHKLTIPDRYVPNLKETWFTDSETGIIYSLKELTELLCYQK